jgi:hypothetical protein
MVGIKVGNESDAGIAVTRGIEVNASWESGLTVGTTVRCEPGVEDGVFAGVFVTAGIGVDVIVAVAVGGAIVLVDSSVCVGVEVETVPQAAKNKAQRMKTS